MKKTKKYLVFDFDNKIQIKDQKIEIYKMINNTNFKNEKNAQEKFIDMLEKKLTDKKIVSEVKNKCVEQNKNIKNYIEVCKKAKRDPGVNWRSDTLIIENKSNTCCELKLSLNGIYHESYQSNFVLYDFIKCSLFVIKDIYNELYKIQERIKEEDWANKESNSYMFCFKKENNQLTYSFVKVKVKLEKCRKFTRKNKNSKEIDTYEDFKNEIFEKLNGKNIIHFDIKK